MFLLLFADWDNLTKHNTTLTKKGNNRTCSAISNCGIFFYSYLVVAEFGRDRLQLIEFWLQLKLTPPDQRKMISVFHFVVPRFIIRLCFIILFPHSTLIPFSFNSFLVSVLKMEADKWDNDKRASYVPEGKDSRQEPPANKKVQQSPGNWTTFVEFQKGLAAVFPGGSDICRPEEKDKFLWALKRCLEANEPEMSILYVSRASDWKRIRD